MSTWHNSPKPHRRLHKGSRGEDVQRFQQALENRVGVPVANDGVVGPHTLSVWREARWKMGLPADHPITVGAQRSIRWPWTRTPAAKRRARARAEQSVTIRPSDGAQLMVDKAAKIADNLHSNTFVVSAFRPGSITSSGNPSDHGSNDFDQAARDIAVVGVDALVGPPQSELDDAVVAIGAQFGRKYGKGVRIVDTFIWNGWRVQIIWRTPEFGGHMGHIHIGIRDV